MRFSHILVPIAGHPAEEQAIRLACYIARQDKARVSLLHVIEVQRHLPLDIEDTEQIQRAESILDNALQIVAQARGAAETEVLQARAAGPVLTDEATARGVDLIIVGIPYRAPFGDFEFGETTLYLLKNASCPVWLCRGAREQPSADSRKVK